MSSLVHSIALVLCVVGCCLMVRHSNWAWRLSAVAMTSSMLDVVVGPHLLPPLGWSALLIGSAIAVATADRGRLGRVRVSKKSPRPAGLAAESLQVSLGSLAMAATMPFMQPADGAIAHSSAHAGHGSFNVLPMLALGTAMYVVVSFHAISRTSRSPARITEAVAMTLSLALMTFTSFLHHNA